MTGWASQAKQNIEKWGLQDRPTLLLAMMEELGELVRASLQFDHDKRESKNMEIELCHVMALGIQFKRRLIQEEKKP